MGYYSRVEFTTKVKKECKEQLLKDILCCVENSPEYLSCSSNITKSNPKGEHKNFKIMRDKIKLSGDYVFYHIEALEIKEDNSLVIDYEQKFYDDEDLANYLKDKVTKGDMIFTGEDNEVWGYRFDGKGKVKGLKGKMVLSETD